MKKGLIIGKFYPLHKGHSYLINYGLSRCDELTVLICDSYRYKIDAKTRQKWIQSRHPRAKVQIIPDIEDDDNSKAWAEHTIEFLGDNPDIVFSSEIYGLKYAQFMNSKHYMVDNERTKIPISATKIREDTQKQWGFIGDKVRLDLVDRIVVVGAESTGTTTLAKAIAERLKSPWVPEYGRLYTEATMTSRHDWNNKDFVHIAKMQQTIENQIALVSSGQIICDTNAVATEVWQKRYLGYTSKRVHEIASKDNVDLYIITGDDIPFVQDGTRDGEHIRHNMQKEFIDHIKQTKIPYIIVNGTLEKRLKSALYSIKNMKTKF